MKAKKMRLKFHFAWIFYHIIIYLSPYYNIIEQLKLNAYMTHAEIQCGLNRIRVIVMHMLWLLCMYPGIDFQYMILCYNL